MNELIWVSLNLKHCLLILILEKYATTNPIPLVVGFVKMQGKFLFGLGSLGYKVL